MALLADELKITIPPYKPYKPDIPPSAIVGPHQFRIPYDAEGNLAIDRYTVWDLREGQKIIVCAGPGQGFKGTMGGIRTHSYMLTTKMIREGHPNHGKGLVKYALGTWWVETAVKGLWPTLPIRNLAPRAA